MRRSICYSEPHLSLSGEVGTWKFSYTTANQLPKGTRLKFDLQSRGREIDWELPQVNLKEKRNLIWLEIPEQKIVGAKEHLEPNAVSPSYEFILPQEIKAGETFSIFLGAPGAKKEQATMGNRTQTCIQRRRPFFLYIDPKGKGDYKEPEIFTIDVKGNVLKNIRVICPSLVPKNKRFDIIIRFEDVFGNLTNNAPEGTLISLSYEHLRENLNWKLFVPETGFINVPNLYFNEPGIYKIQLHNLKTQEVFFSAPIKCVLESDKSIYWGLLHGETDRIDSAENIETCLRYFRDEKNLNFYATSAFESSEETSNEIWKIISTQVAEFNEAYRFSTFLGMQWFNLDPEEGLRQIIYAKDNKPILRKKEAKSTSLKKIYKSSSIKEFISIPSFSMAKGYETTFVDFDPDFERVVEIYNAWGCSECSIKENNLRPITSQEKKGIFEFEKGSLRKALNNNCRFGFVAGGLDDRGIFEGLYESEQIQYSPGLTAILALEHTREALFQALFNRSCYATTGEKIVLGFSIAGSQMGTELNTKTKPGLSFNRHITGFVAGTAPLKEILIIRNGKPWHSIEPKESHYEFAIDDSDVFSKIALPSGAKDKPPFIYYYLRILQADGHIAWSSPIWIDHTEPLSAQTNNSNGQKKAKKAR